MNTNQQPPSSIYSEEILKKNLYALSIMDRGLFERICWSVDSDHIAFDERGVPCLKIHRHLRPLSLSEGQCDNLLAPFKGSGGVLIMGIGNGELADRALISCPDGVIHVWDRDPWLLRLSLMKKDYSRFIESNRLVFLLGIDLVFALDRLEDAGRIIHPLFEDLYQNEWIISCNGLMAKRALLCAGHLFVDDVADALRAEGYSVFTLDYSILSMEEIENVFKGFKPDLVFCINYIQGLSACCEGFKTPLICWEIDPSIDLIEPVRSEGSYIFTYRKANVDLFLRAGLVHASYWPLAANPERRFPAVLEGSEGERYACRVSFVGESMVEQAQVLLNRFIRLCTAFGVDRQDALGRTEMILTEQRRDFSAFSIPGLLHDSLPELFSDPVRIQAFKVDPVMLLGEVAACEKRLAYLKALEGLGINLWGDAGWQGIAGNGAVYRGGAGHRFEINRIYSSSLINIDINRLYQTDIVTMRVFDVLACGGFCLTEYTENIQELFKVGEELDVYRSINEMKDKTGYYIDHPDLARKIAQKGRERVLKDHTILKRVAKMLSIAGLSQ